MTNETKQMEENGRIIRVASELWRAWKFKMPAKETPAITTKEHIKDLVEIAKQEGILEAIKYDLSLSFRHRSKDPRFERSAWFIPSHPLNVKKKYDSWSKSGRVTPEELYGALLGATLEQYEVPAQRVAEWYGFSERSEVKST